MRNRGKDAAKLYAMRDSIRGPRSLPTYQALPHRDRRRSAVRARLIGGITLSALGSFALLGAFRTVPETTAVGAAPVVDTRSIIRVLAGGAAVVGALFLVGTAEHLTRE